jgi:hypothetical protein
MKKSLLATLVIYWCALISGCTTNPLIERCKQTTPSMSSERWNCIQEANAQVSRQQAQERAAQYQSSGGNSSSDNLNTYMLLQMQQQSIQNNINLLNAPKYTEPTPVVRGNTQPFQQQAPQQPIQNPSVNCVPNGFGGFRCQ